MECDYCNHVEHYEDENLFFQGEMWGLPDESVMCNACLQSNDGVLERIQKEYEE